LGLASGVLDAGVFRNSADPMTAAPAAAALRRNSLRV
jgi:hypothetical protein